MNDSELADLVRRELLAVAPDLEGESIDPDVPFRAQFEIDSMDLLNFVIGLHRATGLDIPETDYGRLGCVADCVAYLKERLRDA